MGDQPKFYEQKLDRSKHGACLWLALLVLGFFCLSAYLLWQLAGYVKHQHWGFRAPAVATPSISLPTNLQGAAQQQLDSVKQQVEQDALNQAKQQLQQSLPK